MTDDHDIYSEQLAPYARGEFDASAQSRIEAHLSDCSSCRAELSGLRALLAAAGPAMDEIERARLHRAVSSAIPVEPAAPARRGIGARIAPALGAAALLALFVFGAAQVFTGAGGDDESGGADAGAGAVLEADSGEQLADEGMQLGLPPASGKVSAGSATDGSTEPSAQGDTDDGTAAGEDAGSAGGSGGSGVAYSARAAEPYFEPGPRTLSESALRRLGRARDPFVSFAATYTAGDGTDRDAQVTSLTMASPEPAEVRSCAEGVLSRDPNALPAYGALGTFEGRYVLALGFVTAPGGPLDRYDIWVWDFGDCSSVAGALRPITRLQGRI